MTTRDEYAPMFGSPVGGWYRWFAWHPVETVDRGRQWLRVVNRRRIHKHHYLVGGSDWWFQHAVKVSNDNGGNRDHPEILVRDPS